MKLSVFCLFLLLPTVSLAVDGVVEINQACASTGCFSGDGAGLPVTIDGSAGRSYRLTSDLVVPDVNTDGILITTHDVGIDLNNFTIIGVSCVGAITTTGCRPLGLFSGSGIEVDSFSTRFGVAVKNGSIVGMGRRGVSLGYQAEVRNVRVRWNGSQGIVALTGSTIVGNTARQNVGDGIASSDGSTISGNTSFANGGDGIAATMGATISENTVSLNVGNGISASDGSTVSGNTARQNNGDGISVGEASVVTNSSAFRNGGDGIRGTGRGVVVTGTTARFNTGIGINLELGGGAVRNSSASQNTLDGIVAAGGCIVSDNTTLSNGNDGIAVGNGCTVQRNTMRTNIGFGLRILSGTEASYRENTISGNTAGAITGTAVNMLSNSCDGATTCP